MSGDAPPGETENPRFAAEGADETFRRIDSSHIPETQARPRCRCVWVERYLEYLERLNRKSGGGPVSTHFVNVATRAYGSFCASCDPFYRHSSWRAISAACQLFCQRSRSN
jgi:hypothetical protein